MGVGDAPAQTSSTNQASARTGCMCIENSVAQTPCAQRESAKPTAKEIAFRREIQKRIDETIEADKAKHVDGAIRYDLPEFTVKNLDGSVDKREDARKGIQQGYQYILKVTDETYVKIDCLTLKGREATVYINQHFVRTMPDRKTSSPHTVITNITHKEDWVRTSKGWMRRHIDELQRGPSFLDGKPFNPN